MSRQNVLFVWITASCCALTATTQAQIPLPPRFENYQGGSPQQNHWTSTNAVSQSPSDQVSTTQPPSNYFVQPQPEPVDLNRYPVTQPIYPETDAAPAIDTADYLAPNQRMFLQADMLLWTVSRPNATVIGDAASERVVNVGGNSYFRNNSLDTGFIGSDWTMGGRIDFGRMEEQRGWMASVLFYRHRDSLDANGVWFVPNDPDDLLAGYEDSNNDGIDDDINGNRVHGRSGEDLGTPDNNNPGTFLAPFDGTPDQGAPVDSGDLVNFLVTFDTLQASSDVEINGFELMDVYRPTGWARSTTEWFWGLRYLELRDRFAVDASGGVLGRSFWNVDSDNDILGPQIGLRASLNREWYRLTAEGRFLAGINFQKDRLNGSIGGGTTFGGVNEPVAMEATSFNSLQTNTEFSPIGEWRLEASYYANTWLAFRIGYTGMVIGGVSRSSPKVSYSLPNFRLSSDSSTETIFTNGMTLGFEINR